MEIPLDCYGSLDIKKIAYIASYPPRKCGIATFTYDVRQAVKSADPKIEQFVVAMDIENLSETQNYPPEVKLVIPQHSWGSYSKAAHYLNQSGADVVCVQHEFGLFGGEAGEWLLDLLSELTMPVVSVLHTVLPDPSESYLRVAQELARYSQQLILLSESGRQIMQEVYGVNASKLRVIPHGVPDVPFETTENAKTELGLEGRTVLSTFGLINRGKGIEYAIEALVPVVERHPDLLYLVLGSTHPVVRQHEGESYRESLMAQVKRLGLQNHVRFEDRYLDFGDLCEYLAATDIYITPYIGHDQIVSGTLAYALGFGKPIISTPYPYARECLADGRGALVGWQESVSISTVLDEWLSHSIQLNFLRRRIYAYGHEMAWPNVGKQYVRLFEKPVGPEQKQQREQLVTAPFDISDLNLHSA